MIRNYGPFHEILVLNAWVKVFRIIPESRILRLKVSLKILNWVGFYGFFDLFSVYLKTLYHLNLKLLIFVGILHVLRFDFQKFRIWVILNFHPCKRICVKASFKCPCYRILRGQISRCLIYIFIYIHTYCI